MSFVACQDVSLRPILVSDLISWIQFSQQMQMASESKTEMLGNGKVDEETAGKNNASESKR